MLISRRQASTLVVLTLFVLPTSPNYQLHDYSVGGSGGTGTGTTYQVELGTDPTSGSGSGPTNAAGVGLFPAQAAAVPAAPTLSNPDNDYKLLKLVLDPGSAPSDTRYAIAVSPDNFTGTTHYVASDESLTSTLTLSDYRTYADWGGVNGFFVRGLLSDTTYTVQAKALHGGFTESDWGPASSGVTTAAMTLSLALTGVSAAAAVAGITTDVATTATAVNFGELTPGQRIDAAQRLTVTTNADSGYTVLSNQAEGFVTSAGVTFSPIANTNASPGAFPGSTATGVYGYHTTDGTLGTGTTTRFASNDTYAQFQATQREVAYAAGPVTTEVTDIVYSILTGSAQPAGSYHQSLTYIVYGVF